MADPHLDDEGQLRMSVERNLDGDRSIGPADIAGAKRFFPIEKDDEAHRTDAGVVVDRAAGHIDSHAGAEDLIAFGDQEPNQDFFIELQILLVIFSAS